MKNKSKNKSKIQKNKIDKKVRNFEINLHKTMDASVWAREYRRRFGGKKSLLMGWFANAIMCGWDHGVRQCEKEALKVIIPTSSSNIEDFEAEYERPAAFSSVEDRSLTVSAAQAINDFMAASEKHTVTLRETYCDFYDDNGKSLICSASACTLSAAVDVCYETWTRDTIFDDEAHWDWPYDLDEIDTDKKPGD